MTFTNNALNKPRPGAMRRDVLLPRRQSYYPSPVDWREEILYFLLVDRFSDGQEGTRPLLDRTNLPAARPGLPNGQPWRWDLWARSGSERFQGGTLQGVRSKIPYLRSLGVTTLWISPPFKQRGHIDSYHGYGIQDFLDIDARFGTRADLVALVNDAHAQGLRIILDIIFNHSGENWLYPPDTPGGPLSPAYTTGRYPFGSWRGSGGDPVPAIAGGEDGVWPVELQDAEEYTRAGAGDLGSGDIGDEFAEHKRSDFITLRDFRLEYPGVLDNLALCYQHWIALTDCDGFRIDTLKHVTFEQGRNFCGAIKEFAANIGKANFFLVGEVAGGDFGAERYLDALGRNLNAALDIGEMRPALTGLAKGLVAPRGYFDAFEAGRALLGSLRNLGSRHVSILDDHDHVFGQKLRFSSEAAEVSHDRQVVAGVALQLFTLGIPCIYYGTEQAFAGPEASERQWLPDWGRSDRYLREAMFGPLSPRPGGRSGLPPAGPDTSLPGFGPFGTAGRHCFDQTHPAFRRIAAMAALRQQAPVLRYGRQYPRQISTFGAPFDWPGSGEIVPWSRILADEEAVCVVNSHGNSPRGGDIVIDASLNAASPAGAPSVMTVVLNTAEAGSPPGTAVPHPVGSTLPVLRRNDDTTYVEVRNLPPSEVLVLMKYPTPEQGDVLG